MEDDEERKLAEASVHHPDMTDKSEILSPVQNRIEAFDIEDSGTALQGITSADRVFKDDDFEQVSLGNQEDAANESQGDRKEPGRTSNSDHGRSSFGGTEGAAYHLSGTQEMYDLMPMDDVQSDQLSSSGPEREADS